MTTPTDKYLRPWSIVSDDELQLLRQLRTLCEPLRGKDVSYTLYLTGGATLDMGEIGLTIRKLGKL